MFRHFRAYCGVHTIALPTPSDHHLFCSKGSLFIQLLYHGVAYKVLRLCSLKLIWQVD
jgi:hypothetical protein